MKLRPVADRLSRQIINMMKSLRAIDTHEHSELKTRRQGIEAIELETRVLYSASPIPLELVEYQDDANLNLNEAPFESESPSDFTAPGEKSVFEAGEAFDFSLESVPDDSHAVSPREVVFIDFGIPNREMIVADLSGFKSAEIIVLDAGRDGLQQISLSLAERNDVSAVHVISHGSEGQIHLGSTTLSNDNISAHAGQIANWSSSLHADADILFYGCNLAADSDGQELLETISALTDSDVAGSTDLTGHESLGGDWDLEFTQGVVDTRAITSFGLQEEWLAILAAPPTDGSGAIWFTNSGSATSGSDSWNEQNIVQLGDPNLALGSSTTDGTIEISNFASSEAIDGIHLIQSATLVIGDTTLQYGDLLFTVGSSGTFGGVSADSEDILLFRPDSLTDYGSGTYHMFLEDGVHDSGSARNVNGLSVIEKDVNIGGKVLSAGTLVVSRQNPNQEDLFIVHVATTSFGVTGTTSTFAAEKLLNADGAGTNLDFSGRRITGVEVLEDTTTLGGTPLNAGTILLTIDSNSTIDIDSGLGVLNVDGQDIIALDIHTSEFGGFTDATATVLLDGSDIGLTLDDERIYGLSIFSPTAFTPQYSVTVDTTDDIVDGDTTSVAHLLANKGSDGRISLREAIDATNNNANNGSTPDHIYFDIPDSDSGHVYYRNDGIANSLSIVATTTLADASITDFDPDYPYAQQSWFRINLDNSLPALNITDAVFIDGYTQTGSAQNTAALGQNASLKIELTNLTLNSNSGGSDNHHGLTFDSGSEGSTFRGLNINEFGGHGILVDLGVDNITIQGNFIGTDITGTQDIGNGNAGIQLRSNNNVVGGSNVSDRNVISGNDNRGIAFFTTGTITDNLIENNYIGVDSTGLRGLGNDSYGIQLFDTDRITILDNVVADNEHDGIRALAGSEVHNTTIQGNLVGVAADGSTLLANGGSGIRIAADVATGNRIGGTVAGEANVISGNAYHGIALDGSSVSGTSIFGNYIGSDLSGTVNLGNGGDGIFTTRGAFNNFIGGVLVGQANTIAFNNGNGVNLSNTSAGPDDGNSIRGNRIFGNTRLGIDLKDDGNTANDYTTPVADNDFGPNRVQNFPVIQTASYDGTDLVITGTISGRNNILHLVDFYVSSTADPTGYGEAERYLGSISVTTDASGHQSFTAILAGASVSVNEYVTATTTHADGSTSEFALNLQISGSGNDTPIVANPINAYLANEDAPQSNFDLSTTFSDTEDSVLAYTLIGNDTPSLLTANISGNILSFNYLSNQHGLANITVRAMDSQGDFVDHTIAVTVNPINDLPTVTDKSYIAVGSGDASGNVLFASEDVDGDVLTARLVTGPSHGTVVLQANGQFVYVPDPGFVGTDTFEFVAEDGSGNSTTATAEVDVIPAGIVVINGENENNNTNNDDEFAGVLLPTPGETNVTENADEPPRKNVVSRIGKVFAPSNSKPETNDENSDRQDSFSGHASARYSFTPPTEFSPDRFDESFSKTTRALSFTPGMLSSLAAFGNEIDEATNSINYAFVNSIVSFSGFSLVGATWLLRGGALFASMMANVPAWRIIDPLVVLRYSSDEEEGDESLEDILEGTPEQQNTPKQVGQSQPQTTVPESTTNAK